MMKKAKQILREMMIGLGVWLLLVLIILEIIYRGSLNIMFGVLSGGAAAAVLLVHMYHHLDIALDMDAKHAQRHVQIAALQRFAIMAVVLAAAMIGYRYAHPVGAVLGIFGVKLCAYFQPVVHKVIDKT